SNPWSSAMMRGIAVPTIVASSAASSMAATTPVMLAMTTCRGRSAPAIGVNAPDWRLRGSSLDVTAAKPRWDARWPPVPHTLLHHFRLCTQRRGFGSLDWKPGGLPRGEPADQLDHAVEAAELKQAARNRRSVAACAVHERPPVARQLAGARQKLI